MNPWAKARCPSSRPSGWTGVRCAAGLTLLALVALAAWCETALAQAIQFPRGGGIPPSSNFPSSLPGLGSTGVPPASVPPTLNVSPPPGGFGFGQPNAFGAQPGLGGSAPGFAPFDPYSPNTAAAQQFWSLNTPNPVLGANGLPPSSVPPGTFPNSPLPGTGFSNPAGSPYGFPAAPPPPQGQPLYPNGFNWFNDPNSQFNLYDTYRLIEDVRLRHTFIAGGDSPDDLGINDTLISASFTWPNFFTTGQPLFITPAFVYHQWDGPANGIADLPADAYSAYLDFQWASDPNLPLGAELGFRVGVYSDFDTLTDDSLRLQGLGVGVVRLTPTITLKAGVMYLDRNKIKLLPAGGVLWQPSPQTRVDLFFPQPKISQYLSNVGTKELWGYIGAEYGGGAWTVARAANFVDRIDINDIRVFIGMEFTGPGGINGFAEVGYVFDREVVYVVQPGDTLNISESYMVRAGLFF